MGGIYLKLFVDCLEKYQKLNDTEFGRLVRAALRYKATGAEPTDLGREALLWDGMRLDIDRDNEAYLSMVKARSEAGKMGGRPKKQETNGFSENQKKQKVFLESKKSQDKEEDKEEDKDEDKDKDQEKEILSPKAPQGGEDVEFARFWERYPRKAGKERARKAFERLSPGNELLGIMLCALDRQRHSRDWQRDGGQYIPYPASWLNGRRWEDEEEQATGGWKQLE